MMKMNVENILKKHPDLAPENVVGKAKEREDIAVADEKAEQPVSPSTAIIQGKKPGKKKKKGVPAELPTY